MLDGIFYFQSIEETCAIHCSWLSTTFAVVTEIQVHTYFNHWQMFPLKTNDSGGSM